MGKKLDLTGQRFGRLTVLKEAGKNCGHITWLCRCDCGNEIIVKGIHLTSGHTTSCTCRQKEVVAAMRFEDLTGKKFGRLTVIENLGTNKNGTYEWLCQCECGNYKVAVTSHLKTGVVRSCGCLVSETTAKRNYKNGMFVRHEGDITFSTWSSMWHRCMKEGEKYYHDKGISVCERWRNYDAFLEDMGPRPSLEMTIDRIDFNGNYEPGNCRWATHTQQANNTSKNRRFEINGESLTIAQISRACGISQMTIIRRLQKGLTIEQATTLPLIPGKRLLARIS